MKKFIIPKRRTFLRRITTLLCYLLFVSALAPAVPVCARDDLKNTDPDKYYILLDLTNQMVTVYERDDQGEYTRVVRRFLCSTGKSDPRDPEDPEDQGSPTPTGIWKIGGRERFGKFANFSSEYARYWTQIVSDIYFHSIMFKKRDVNSMQSGPFSKMGTKASHGCVRLYVEDAKWLYYYACPGTTICVSDSEPKQNSLKKALKSKLSFKAYNELQKGFYDEEELPNDFAWTIADGVRMRKEGKDSASTVKKLSADTEVEVLLDGESWVKVRFDGKEGYIRRGYLTFSYGETDTCEDAHLIKKTVWLLNGPDSKADRICKIPFDVSVPVLDRSEDGKWLYVRYHEEYGYIPSNYVKTAWGLDLHEEEQLWQTSKAAEQDTGAAPSSGADGNVNGQSAETSKA